MVDLNSIINATQSLSLGEFYATAETLGMYIVAMALYAIFVFAFYRFVARRDVFKINFDKYRGGSKAAMYGLYVLGYLIIFPILIFLWFGVFSLFLIFLAKTKVLTSILLLSMALIGAIRICAYVHEDLSRDLAKLLPLALLAVFLIDQSYLNIAASIDLLYTIPAAWKMMVYYLGFVILLEFIMRLLKGTWTSGKKRRTGRVARSHPPVPRPRQPQV